MCLDTMLADVIHMNQTAYMSQHFIGINIRSVQDFIDFTEENQLDHTVLFLDFKKAFDSMLHHFLFKLLQRMCFPPEFIKWVGILYSNAVSVVHHNNWMSPVINLSQGMWQGYPLSCHIFNMVVQVLIFALHAAGFFDWWTFSSDPCSLYANDISLFTLNIDQLGPMI